MVSLQIPILFDISAAGVVFGEDVSGVDIFDAHLKFTLDNTGANNPAAEIKTVFQNILYADASENDVSGVLFYYNETLSGNAISASAIAKVIQAAILNGKLKQYQGGNGIYNGSDGSSGSAGTASSDPDQSDWQKRYQAPGIPLPMYGVALTSQDSTSGPVTGQQYYTDAICDSGGTNFGRVLIRLMATSLMGHPFAQGFIKNEAQIMKDISDCDISTQLGDNLFKGYYTGDDDQTGYPKNRDISGVSQAIGSANDNFDSNSYAFKSAGIHNGILQQMYEQLFGSAPDRFDLSNNGASFSPYSASDFSGNDIDSGKVYPNRLPIRAGDTISFYFRPRVQISMDTDAAAGVSASTVSDDSGVHDAGVQNEGDVANTYAAQNTTLGSIFFQPRHRWISHKNNVTINTADGKLAVGGGDGVLPGTHKHCDSAGKLRMEGTNLIAADNNKLFFDAHVWRILCQIPSS